MKYEERERWDARNEMRKLNMWDAKYEKAKSGMREWNAKLIAYLQPRVAPMDLNLSNIRSNDSHVLGIDLYIRAGINSHCDIYSQPLFENCLSSILDRMDY